MAIDQKAFVIPGPDMDGLWDRGIDGFGPNTCPKTGFTSSNQIRYLPGGIRTRQGYTGVTSNAAWTNPKQIIQYSTNNTTTGAVFNGFLIVGGTGDVYDSLSPTPGVAIMSIGSTSYISILTLFGRIYITTHGLDIGTNTYVNYYLPGSGSAVSGTGGSASNIILAGTTFVSSGTAGNVVQGSHIFGVAFETRTGHITQLTYLPPTASSVGVFNIANANQQVTATNVPISADPVVKRHILASKVITGYSGNPTDYELFFVATISGNVTTTITFNFTDESLVDSADYLYDLLVGIPSGVGLTWYSNRLLVYGVTYTGPVTPAIGPSVIWASLPGKPESLSTVDGFIEVFKDDGEYGIVNAFEQDGMLVVNKPNKTYATRDNQDVPNTWQVAAVDYTLGSIVFGVTKSLNSTGAAKSGKTIVITQPGVYIFQGQFIERPLTWKIERRWKELTQDSNYKAFQILDVPQAQSFLIKVFDNTYGQYYWLVADYSRGLDWQNIRWSEWHPTDSVLFMTLHNNTTVYFVSGTGTGIANLPFGSTTDFNTTNDNGSRILGCELTTGEIKFDDVLNSYQIVQVKIRGHIFDQTDTGFTPTLVFGDDINGFSGVGQTPTPIFTPKTVSPNPEIIKAIVNVQSYYTRMRISWTAVQLVIRHLVIFGKVNAEDKLTV